MGIDHHGLHVASNGHVPTYKSLNKVSEGTAYYGRHSMLWTFWICKSSHSKVDHPGRKKQMCHKTSLIVTVIVYQPLPKEEAHSPS